MAQQWDENNSEIAFEIVCSLDLKNKQKIFQLYMQINFRRWVDFFKTMLVIRITMSENKAKQYKKAKYLPYQLERICFEKR